MKTNDVASVVLFVNWLECFREIWTGLETKETLLLVPQDSCCKIIWDWPFTLKGTMSRFFALDIFFFRRHINHIFDRSFGNRQAIRLWRNNKSFTNNMISISNHHVASSCRKLEKDISLDKIRCQPTSDEIGPVFPPIINYKAKKIYVCLRPEILEMKYRNRERLFPDLPIIKNKKVPTNRP
jgi:hypothetical protein